jgi:hypothetical protein
MESIRAPHVIVTAIGTRASIVFQRRTTADEVSGHDGHLTDQDVQQHQFSSQRLHKQKRIPRWDMRDLYAGNFRLQKRNHPF